MKHVYLCISFILFFCFSVLADGTKQLMPPKEDGTPQGVCYISIGQSQSVSFARYHGTTSASQKDRIYIRIMDAENEEIHFGVGDQIFLNQSNSLSNISSLTTINYRIMNPSGVQVQTGSLNTGNHITTYKQAINGPKTNKAGDIINSNGYKSICYKPGDNSTPKDTGNYWIEFDIGTAINSYEKIVDFQYFDVTVLNSTTNELVNGRVWAYEWGLSPTGSPGGFQNEVWATFYTRSTDQYTSKVYFAGAKPYRFILGCNSFGATDEFSTAEENRQSYPNKNTFKPEYRIFLTRPDDDEWGGEADPPNVPEQLSFAGDAITCEDLIFVVQLLNTQDATVELFIDGTENGEGTDKVLVEKLDASKSNKGYHYPWKDNTHITEAGTHWYSPSTTDACPRTYKLSLFDQRFQINTDATYNYGDTIPNVSEIPATDVNFGAYSGSLGCANNPIILDSYEALKELADALEEKRDFKYTMDNFYYTRDPATGKVILDDTGHPKGKSITMSIQGGNNGFEGVNFYWVVPTFKDEITSWAGIGTADNPFKGTFRCGRYNPNPASDNLDEKYKSEAGDQDTIPFLSNHALFNYCDGATIDNVHVKGEFYPDPIGGYCGDITNYPNSDGENENDKYLGDDNLYNGFGAICSYAKNTTFRQCTNAATITGDISTDKAYIGGIVGIGINCTLDSCANRGKIISNTNEGTGGIAGALSNCTNTIKINDSQTANINFCYNIGTITAESNVGGIVGEILDGSATLYACKNDGAINATTDNAGGIIGQVVTTATLSDCSNSAYISGDYGLIGAGGTGTIQYCLNTSNANDELAPSKFTIEKSVTINTNTSTGTTYTVGEGNLDAAHFYNNDGEIILMASYCCGRIWRNEDAGRLFSDDKSYYMAWDGKDDNGDCITGTLDVNYHKNSGVTHFPFYDPENIQVNETTLKGMVAYRISPIVDETVEEYKALPESYFQKTNFSTTEKGIELPLFWDDRKISYSSKCDFDTKVIDGQEFTYGKTTILGETEERKYCEEVRGCQGKLEKITKKYYACTDTKSAASSGNTSEWENPEETTNESTGEWKGVGDPITIIETTTTWVEAKDQNGKVIKNWNGKTQYTPVYTTTETQYYPDYTGQCTKDGLKIKTKDYYYCSQTGWWTSQSGTCITEQIVKDGKTVCQGITNVDAGGYLGSTGGGHIFPYVNKNYDNDGFGNNNTMNTWWNGVEVVGKSILVLKENEPAILMPIVISKWITTNLTNSVLLEWTTSSEENNDYFTIERSYDGVHWTALGRVHGAGTTSMANDYSFEDNEPLTGISYYRLKQTDFNGEFSYSSIKCINRTTDKVNAFKAYTKKNDDCFIIEGEQIAACTIEVYDVLGHKVSHISYNTISTDKVAISVSDIPTGTYIIKACNQAKSVVKNW